MSKEENISAFIEMTKAAKPLESSDLELMVRRLDELAAIRRPVKEVEAEYEQLRDKVAAILAMEGPRYYVDQDGVKRYAYVVAPDPVVIYVHELIQMGDEGLISEAALNLPAPRTARPDREDQREAGHAHPFLRQIHLVELIGTKALVLREQGVVADDQRGIAGVEHRGHVRGHRREGRRNLEPAGAQNLEERHRRPGTHVQRNRQPLADRHPD